MESEPEVERDRVITDGIAGILVRYFQRGVRLNPHATQWLPAVEDLRLLTWHWALSRPVQDLLDDLLSGHARLTTHLKASLQEGAGLIKGRIDAAKTARLQALTGDSSRFISRAPGRTLDSTENSVVAWVLRESHRQLTAASTVVPPNSSYGDFIAAATAKVDLISRTAQTKDLMQLYPRHGPLAGAAMARARSSRNATYRLAAAAADMRRLLEARDQDTVSALLHETALGPAEKWQRYELFVALRMGEALSEQSGEPIRLFSVAQTSGPLLAVGRIEIYWQQQTNYYNPEPPDRTELRTRTLWSAFGFSTSFDRPDIVAVDTERRMVTAVAEVKHTSLGSDQRDAFRQGLAQLSRYCSCYASGAEVWGLLERSFVTTIAPPPQLVAAGPGFPSGLGLADVLGGLNRWAARVLAA